MKNLLYLLLLVLFAIVAFFINHERRHASEPASSRRISSQPAESIKKQTEKNITAETIATTSYLEKYIVDVIDHGSSQGLGFKYGDMPAHMADEKAAPKIAAYVVTLSGRKPTHPEWVQEGRLLFISNCGGCHGEDGRGIHGTFPDLTRDPLLGIQKRLEEAN